MAYEDFTTYVEADPGSDITVTANKLDVWEIPNNVDAWVYADKGAGHFGTTFEHDFKLKIEYDRYNRAGSVWGVSNVVEDAYYWSANNSQALYVLHVYDNRIQLREAEATDSDIYTGSQDSTYYPTAERTGDTTAVLRIYSDEAQTDLLDTLAVAVPSGRSYRYMFAYASWNTGDAGYISHEIENLDLNEGAPPAGLDIAIAMHHYEMLRN